MNMDIDISKQHYRQGNHITFIDVFRMLACNEKFCLTWDITVCYKICETIKTCGVFKIIISKMYQNYLKMFFGFHENSNMI